MTAAAAAVASGASDAGGPAEAVRLGDGTVMHIARPTEVDEGTWGEIKSYLEANPEIAKGLQNFSKDPEAMRGWLLAQAVAEHYEAKLEAGDEEVAGSLQALEDDDEVGFVFDGIKRNGLGAAMQYWDDEALLLKISAKMGGVPPELRAALGKIETMSLSLHEAACHGDIKGIHEHLKKGMQVEAADAKGVTALGYAIGADRLAAVEVLLESGADPCRVDASGNTGLHLAAGYGRQELLKRLLRLGIDANKANNKGQTPLTVARMNKHQACVDLLVGSGAA